MVKFDTEEEMILGRRPIWMLDTSAINALADDVEGEALIVGLASGCLIRLPFTAISEVIATACASRRKTLVDVCRKILLSGGDIVSPQHEIVKVLAAQFEQLGRIDVMHLPLRVEAAEAEIRSDMDFDDELATQEREEARANNKVFADVYAHAKLAFDELAASGVAMPRTAAELVSALEQGGAFWTSAKELYDRVATKPSTDATIRKFYNEAEPFRALLVAIFVAQFDRCIKSSNAAPTLKSGRNDTFMATCLPFCDVFVTADGGQQGCYREVVSIAGLAATVRSYTEFRNGILVPTN